VAVLTMGAFIIYSSLPGPVCEGSTDEYIISAILEARSVMVYLEATEGSYDNFTCQHEDMLLLCQEIVGRGKSRAIITRSPAENSQAACFFSYLPVHSQIRRGFWRRKRDFWFCVDSTGRAGYTRTNPESEPYCQEGLSAVCPEFIE